MGMFEMVITSAALAADAFAASICKGLSTEKTKIKQMLTVGLWFGFFQMLMIYIGMMLGDSAMQYIEAVDHWVSFALLSFMGASMLFGAASERGEESGSFSFFSMLSIALATSVDALAAGVGLSVGSDFADNTVKLSLTVGAVTFLLAFLGVRIGNSVGEKYAQAAEIGGGAVLILMGFKILFSHLQIFA